MNRKIFFTLFSLSLIFTPFFQVKAYTKDEVGLNVHWALGGFTRDKLYYQRLKDSRTMWAREHFYHEVIMDPAQQEAWFERYDLIMAKYKSLNIKVVGMLAYGETHGDFHQPDLDEWEQFVYTVVQRYKHDVVAWEIWNEPDSPDYLRPNNPETYIPLLERATPVIHRHDPGALVLGGVLASPNHNFVRRLYKDASGLFDALAFHVYTCREPDFINLRNKLNEVDAVIKEYNPDERVWVTELGCSTGSAGISHAKQVSYIDQTLDMLFEYPWMERAFVYNIRNRDDVDAYENNFGLLDLDMQPLPGWEWYYHIDRGPYDVYRLPLVTEQAKADELRAALERYFGEGLIPVSQENWPTLVNAYVYGDYPVTAIAQSIRFGGKTVHPTIPFDKWRNRDEYKQYINKDWTGKMFVHAYGKPRQFVSVEAEKSAELMSTLKAEYDFDALHINSQNWQKLVNAYVYGKYPVDAIARAMISGGKTVHPEIDWYAWRNRPEYAEGMKIVLP